MIDRFFVHPVTLVRPAVLVDRYGDDVADWDNAARTDVRGWMARRSTTEIRDGREELVSDWELTLPVDVDVAASDRVEAAGTAYEIVGEPEVAPTPGGFHHKIVALRTFRG